MDSKPVKILVADDEPRVLRFIEISLKVRGFEVDCVTSGEEVLEHVRNDEPDLLLLDIVMPDMNGFEVLQRLREFSDLPVIAFSASGINRYEAIRSGANEFVNKPFNPDEIISKVTALIGRNP